MRKGMKMIALLLAIVLVVSMFAACGNKPAGGDDKQDTKTGVYTIYNVTGENVKELYIYEGDKKGDNLAAKGFKNNKTIVAKYDGTEKTTLTLEFTTESGVTKKFETLHIEEAPIALLSQDAMTGATPIKFAIPEDEGKYKIVNATGEVVKELYVYPVGKEKGTNYAGEGMAKDASVDVNYTGAVDTTLIVEFTTDKDGTKKFETLHIETATINLLGVDGMTGATPISFGY